MKRTTLRTLLGAAAANGTLIGVAVSDKPQAPLFREAMPRTAHDCLPGDGYGQHITLDGDSCSAQTVPVEQVTL